MKPGNCQNYKPTAKLPMLILCFPGVHKWKLYITVIKFSLSLSLPFHNAKHLRISGQITYLSSNQREYNSPTFGTSMTASIVIDNYYVIVVPNVGLPVHVQFFIYSAL